MDTFTPYHDDEAKGVLFEVEIDGRSAQGYISCVLLAMLGGPASRPEDWVAVYRSYQSMIDAAVTRRAAAEGWDTVMVKRADLSQSR